jgi:hypothetical protein
VQVPYFIIITIAFGITLRIRTSDSRGVGTPAKEELFAVTGDIEKVLAERKLML